MILLDRPNIGKPRMKLGKQSWNIKTGFVHLGMTSDDQCLADLETSHWPDGVCCPTWRAKDLLEQFEPSLNKGREVLRAGAAFDVELLD
jgi:hypothetical protein